MPFLDKRPLSHTPPATIQTQLFYEIAQSYHDAIPGRLQKIAMLCHICAPMFAPTSIPILQNDKIPSLNQVRSQNSCSSWQEDCRSLLAAMSAWNEGVRTVPQQFKSGALPALTTGHKVWPRVLCRRMVSLLLFVLHRQAAI